MAHTPPNNNNNNNRSSKSNEIKMLLANVLNSTDSSHKGVVDDYIMAYPLYWCLSAMDYYWAATTDDDENYNDTNNDTLASFVDQLITDIGILLDKRIDDFLDPNLDITWFGWDDRIGNGWCFHSKHDACTREGLLAFAGLVIRVCNDFVRLLQSRNNRNPNNNHNRTHNQHQHQNLVEHYQAHSNNMTQALRDVHEYPSGFGVHAAANAINANVATQTEIREHWMGTTTTPGNKNESNNDTLNNAVTICSFSQFNQYWILQAFGNIEGGLEHALRTIDLCWGPMMELSTGGCFWELSSREWLSFLSEGDQVPHLPSYCHPWASGVTPWLSRVVGGVAPLGRGYSEFVATPYVSRAYPSVETTTPTPHGPIHVRAELKAHGANQNTNNNHHTNHTSSPLPPPRSLLGFDFEATVHAFVIDCKNSNRSVVDVVDCPSSGLFGVRKSVAAVVPKEAEAQTTTTTITSILEVPLVIETIELNGVPVAILDAQTVASKQQNLFLPNNKNNNNKNIMNLARIEEYVFLELGGKDDPTRHGNGSRSYVVRATYLQTMDNSNASSDTDTTTSSIGDDNGLGGVLSTVDFPNDAGGVTQEYSRSLSNTNSTGQLVVSSTRDVSPFPVPFYPAVVREPFDDHSQGDGLLVYGADGYWLMGCKNNKGNADRRWLPAYVQNVTIRRHGFPGWELPDEHLVGYSDTDPVYLPLPGEINTNGSHAIPNRRTGATPNTTTAGTTAKRVLGTVGIDDQGGGDINCILVDVKLLLQNTEAAAEEETEDNNDDDDDDDYFLSIYFVASRPGNKHAIRVMDGDTLEVIAPTTLVADYQGGIWWTLQLPKRRKRKRQQQQQHPQQSDTDTNTTNDKHPSTIGVRLKMMDIEGIHLSAIAFATNLPPHSS